MADNKPKYHKLQSLSASVELPTIAATPTTFVARVFFKDCDGIPKHWLDYYSPCSDIKFHKGSWDKEKLSALLDGTILTPQQKEQILAHDSYAELTREIDGTPKRNVERAWDMIVPMAALYQKAVGVQFMSFAYMRFHRTAFFNSLNLAGTKFSLSDDGCLTYTSRGLHDFGVHEVEYVLPKTRCFDYGQPHATWLHACTTEEMLEEVMAAEHEYIRLFLPFRFILDEMLLKNIPLEPGIYQFKDNTKEFYKIEPAVLNTGDIGIRITSLAQP